MFVTAADCDCDCAHDCTCAVTVLMLQLYLYCDCTYAVQRPEWATTSPGAYATPMQAGPGTQQPGMGMAPPGSKDCILLAACAGDEILPQNADLPADVFTACLTTPIKIALRW